jgi:hypothetical protein
LCVRLVKFVDVVVWLVLLWLGRCSWRPEGAGSRPPLSEKRAGGFCRTKNRLVEIPDRLRPLPRANSDEWPNTCKERESLKSLTVFRLFEYPIVYLAIHPLTIAPHHRRSRMAGTINLIQLLPPPPFIRQGIDEKTARRPCPPTPSTPAGSLHHPHMCVCVCVYSEEDDAGLELRLRLRNVTSRGAPSV